MPITRRDVLKAGVVTAATWSIGGRAHASDRTLRHAVIGLGGMGRNHVKAFAAAEGCSIAAVCDVDPERRKTVVEWLDGKFEATVYDDFRELLADDSIDSVSVATPDHWHTPVALHALLAGKHVYVEKPCSHNIHEALILDKLARETGLCVQHGTQHRSGTGPRDAIKLIHDGGIGTVRMAKSINHQFRGPIGHAEPTEPPPGVNYDMWLGPAPVHPFTKNRWHYHWHWFWDYGTGDAGNDGVHQLDVMQWGMGVDLPQRVTSVGAQLFYDDEHETPDTQTVIYEYENVQLMYEMRLWTNYKMDGHDNGVIFYGDKGTVEVDRNGAHLTLIGEPRKRIGDGVDLDAHVGNFLACVRAGTPDQLNAPIAAGSRSTILAHLANVGTRVGRPLHVSSDGTGAVGDPEATALFQRSYRPEYALPYGLG